MNRLNIRSMPNPDYFVQTEIDRLRVNVGFSGTDKKVIVVTSSVPNEGKSYITVNLWRELANGGKRVCLMDCDMRKSALRNTLQFSTENGEELKGLSHYLSGQVEATDIVYSTNIERAYLIPTLTQINPSLLLEGNRMDKLLALLKNNFDYVIIDTPPLRVVSDGKLMAAKSDGCIIVIRAHETSKNDIKHSIKQIESIGCPLLGVVLNRVETKRSRGYYTKEYYSKYYAHSEDINKNALKEAEKIGENAETDGEDMT